MKIIADSLIRLECLEVLKEPPVLKKIKSPNGNNHNYKINKNSNNKNNN